MFPKLNIASIALIALVALAAALISIGVIISGIKSDLRELTAIKKESLALVLREQEVEKFKRNYDGYKPNLEKVSRLFVNPEDPVELIKFLEDSGNNFIEISIAPSAKKDLVHLSILAVESFSNIINFLSLMENGPYLIEVQELNIKQASRTAPEQGKVEADFLIAVSQKP